MATRVWKIKNSMWWWGVSNGSNCIWTSALQCQHNRSESYSFVTLKVPGSSSEVFQKYFHIKKEIDPWTIMELKMKTLLIFPFSASRYPMFLFPPAVFVKSWSVCNFSLRLPAHGSTVCWSGRAFCFRRHILSSEGQELSNCLKFIIIMCIFLSGKRFDEHIKVLASITEAKGTITIVRYWESLTERGLDWWKS